MDRRTFIALLGSAAIVQVAEAQQAKVYRVGIILEGGPFYALIDGLKDGLRDLGFAEGRQYVLEIRDLKGDRKSAEEAARSLEREKVDLIYVIANSLAIAARRATTEIPIVFAVGSDPVATGLVESFAKPGGRLTGVHYVVGDLTAKRLEILKAILPRLRSVVMFYDPGNADAIAGVQSARGAARELNIEILERRVASVEELRRGLIALRAQDADAYFHSNDGMVTSQAQFIIDTARTKKLPTMFAEQGLAAQGALVGYGVSYYEAGRLSAKYVQQIFTGANPKNLAVESLSKVGLAVNLKTARELGLTIPQVVLLRADKVIE
jgi:putative tryptophan/tyrosine transport system substrate-binding protein